MMNIDRSQISRYENGEDYPPIDILIKFAQIYKTSLDELVGYECERTNKISQLLSNLNDNNFKLLVMLIEPLINAINKYMN